MLAVESGCKASRFCLKRQLCSHNICYLQSWYESFFQLSEKSPCRISNSGHWHKLTKFLTRTIQAFQSRISGFLSKTVEQNKPEVEVKVRGSNPHLDTFLSVGKITTPPVFSLLSITCSKRKISSGIKIKMQLW